MFILKACCKCHFQSEDTLHATCLLVWGKNAQYCFLLLVKLSYFAHRKIKIKGKPKETYRLIQTDITSNMRKE